MRVSTLTHCLQQLCQADLDQFASLAWCAGWLVLLFHYLKSTDFSDCKLILLIAFHHNFPTWAELTEECRYGNSSSKSLPFSSITIFQCLSSRFIKSDHPTGSSGGLLIKHQWPKTEEGSLICSSVGSSVFVCTDCSALSVPVRTMTERLPVSCQMIALSRRQAPFVTV